MSPTSSSKALALVVLILIIVHIVVSLSLTIASFSKKTKTGQTAKSMFHTWNSVFWSVSFIVCIILLILVAIIFKLLKEVSDTPCPIQISNPGDKSAVRNSIKDVLGKVQSNPLNKVNNYDSNATYLVITGKYLKEWKPVSLPSDPTKQLQNVLQLFSQFPYIPIGTLKNSKIYNLKGDEIWPDFTYTTLPPFPPRP